MSRCYVSGELVKILFYIIELPEIIHARNLDADFSRGTLKRGAG